MAYNYVLCYFYIIILHAPVTQRLSHVFRKRKKTGNAIKERIFTFSSVFLPAIIIREEIDRSQV